MRWIVGIAMLALLIAAAPRKGAVYVAAGTTDFERDFSAPAANLRVYAVSADVQVLIKPHYANQDTFIVRGGKVKDWAWFDVYGFKVIRTTSTAVDVEWW